MTTQTQFEKGQPLFFRDKEGNFIPCEYVQHFRADVHVVLAAGARHWKDTEELLTEKPAGQ